MRLPQLPSGPLPRRPYRSSAIFHLGLAVLIPIAALLTGGDLSRAVVFAVGFFVLATAWSWWRWHGRLAAEERPAAASRDEGSP